jgi:hypothetical protein
LHAAIQQKNLESSFFFGQSSVKSAFPGLTLLFCAALGRFTPPKQLKTHFMGRCESAWSWSLLGGTSSRFDFHRQNWYNTINKGVVLKMSPYRFQH